MDVRLIDQEALGSLGGMYMHGTFLFGVDLLDASARKKRKFRKWLMKHYTAQFYELSEDIQHRMASDISDQEFVAFLAACHCELERRLQKRRAKSQQILDSMDKETAAAIETVLEWEEWTAPRNTGAAWELTVDENAAFRRCLILQNVDGEGYQEENYLVDSLMLEQDGGHYVITGRLEGADTPLRMSFSNAFVRVENFDPVGAVIVDEPWQFLSLLACQILEKLALPGNNGTDKERRLMPLLEELERLRLSGKGFPLMIEIAISHGLPKVARILENAKQGKQVRLRQRLCRCDCEPLWRDIFDMIRDSQSAYPKAVEVMCDPEQLSQDRNTITRVLNRLGYTGNYPLFEKLGRVDGLHLVSSYGRSYFVHHEKEAVFRLLCVENHLWGRLNISILAGTAFPRKTDIPQDVYSCLFDGNGRRFAHVIYDPRYYMDPETVDFKQMAQIAAKRAEFRKLTREERALSCSSIGSGWGLFFGMLLFAGGLFGVAMTIGFALIAILMALLFGAASEIPDLMTSIPWWQILVFCWIGFGGSMGIVEVLAKHK